ncbi:MAG: PKD domain-containing protein [Bacteroidia bacterium]
MKQNTRLFRCLRFLLLPLLGILMISPSLAQPITVSGPPPSHLQRIKDLFGAGVTISNIVVNCDTVGTLPADLQMGGFTAPAGFGVTAGILLTSGTIQNAVGPNNSGGSTGATTANISDPTLNTLPGVLGTKDACVIEFDMVPYCDTVAINYIFGSEEYLEFVGSFNDVFGFFITGQNPAGGTYTNTNIATVPGTTTFVSINNVNNVSNSAYYVNNGTGTTPNATQATQYDGYTVPLTAVAYVVPCTQYHVKIAVADDLDQSLDSGVFLESGGIGCTSAILDLGVGSTLGSGNTNIAIEGCIDGFFTFSLGAPQPQDLTFNFIMGGTATPGIDYTAFSPQVTLLAGTTTVTVPVTVLTDGITEGPETVQLIYLDSLTCSTQLITDTVTLVIYDGLAANAGADQTYCSGNTATIGIPTAAGVSYNWSPSVGLSATNIAQPVVSLTNTTGSAITQQYTLISQLSSGICPDTATVTVTVLPSIDAAFNATPAACLGFPTQLNDMSTGSAATTWAWTSAGSGLTIPNMANPTINYTTSGTYPIKLIVTNAFGCTDSATGSTIIHPNPTPSFTAPSVCHNVQTIFAGSSTTTTTNWNWNLGNGTPQTQQNFTYTYPVAGNYPVSLDVVDNNGCVGTVTQNVTVFANPVAAFTTPGACMVNAAQFINQTTQGSGNITVYSWNFGDNQTSNVVNPTHNYAQFGVYNVSLNVTDANGCTSSVIQPYNAYPQPIVAFTVTDICEDQVAQFVNGSSVSNGNIVAFQWAFGDNTTESGTVSPTHPYPNHGIYSVELIATTDRGCKDSLTRQLRIFPRPVVNFERENVCINDTTHFINTSTIDNVTVANDTIITLLWEYGDGFNSILPNPNHLYDAPGTYTVKLTAISDKGCQDDNSHQVIVFPPAESPMIANDTVCNGKTATLVAGSEPGKVVKWYYNIYDVSPFFTGNVFQLTQVQYPHTFYVETVSQHGCLSGRLPVMASLYPEASSLLIVDDTIPEIPNAVVNAGVATNIPIVSYSWDFGDGVSSTVGNPAHEYQYPGRYTIDVKTIDIYGCLQELSKQVEVAQVMGYFVPSAFSPNGDGINDEFKINYYNLANFLIQVYDRWGKVVYESSDPNFRWTGKDKKGKDLPEGVYIVRTKGNTAVGKQIDQTTTVTIVR